MTLPDIPEILSTQVIAKEPDRYIGWSTIERMPSGELVAVFSGDRESHVCPWGKMQLGDGSIYTVFYQIDQPGEKTSLMGVKWRVPAPGPGST